jgi:hypothetical protein
MKKSAIHLSIIAILTIVTLIACKKKEDNSSTSSSSSSSSGTTTGGTTTGGTTTGGNPAPASNTLTILSGTSTLIYNLVNFGTNSVTANITGYCAYPLPNFWSLCVTLPSSTLAVNATYSGTNTPLVTGGNCFVYLVNGGTVYSQTGGTITASAVNSKQRIQFNNLTFTSNSSTVTASADYVQP